MISQFKTDICDKITRNIQDKLSEILKNAKIADDGLMNLNADFNTVYDLFCKYFPEKNYLEIQLIMILKQIFSSPISEVENFRSLIKNAEDEKKIRLNPDLINIVFKKRKNTKLKIDKI